MSRRAKLVCTLGPSTWTAPRVRALVEAGMDVARVNFSHAGDDQRREAARLVREAAEAAGRTVALMADLPGPKVRLGELAAGTIRLRAGDRFVLRSGDGPGDATGASTTHAGLPQDLRPGDRVLLADGAVELTVRDTDGARVVTEVARGGRVTSRAGVSVPAARLSVSSITEKDRAGLAAALDLGFDLVGQSFVRSPEDVETLRALMGARPIPIVAKIETGPAVAAASGIVDIADAVMVARGDLGVDRPLEEVPIIQKEIVRACRLAGVPSIVATQMLESMVGAPRPTRAEVSDVANAILDGADAVMLSAETAIGRYPVEAARTAVAVAEIAEARGHDFRPSLPDRSTTDPRRAVARAATRLGHDQAGVRAIACFARTGRTAGLIAAERPPVPLFVFASDPSVLRMLAGVWGVTALALPETPHDVDAMIAAIDRGLVGGGHLDDGDRVVLVGAAPAGIADTNLIKLHRLGSPGYR